MGCLKEDRVMPKGELIAVMRRYAEENMMNPTANLRRPAAETSDLKEGKF